MCNQSHHCNRLQIRAVRLQAKTITPRRLRRYAPTCAGSRPRAASRRRPRLAPAGRATRTWGRPRNRGTRSPCHNERSSRELIRKGRARRKDVACATTHDAACCAGVAATDTERGSPRSRSSRACAANSSCSATAVRRLTSGGRRGADRSAAWRSRDTRAARSSTAARLGGGKGGGAGGC